MQGPIARSDGEIPDNEFAAVMRHQGRQDALHDTFRGRRLHEGLVLPRATIGPPARTRLPAASDSSGFIRDTDLWRRFGQRVQREISTLREVAGAGLRCLSAVASSGIRRTT